MFAASPPPRQLVFLFEGRSRQNIISYISRPRSGVELGGNFKTIFWPDPILQVRLHPGIFHVLPLPSPPTSLIVRILIYLGSVLNGCLGTGNKARKAKYNVRASILIAEVRSEAKYWK